MRSLVFLPLTLFSVASFSEPFGNWSPLSDYAVENEHEIILEASMKWAADNIDHVKQRYNYEYKIRHESGSYNVFVMLAKYSDKMEPSYTSGGHFILSLNNKGQIIKASMGM